MKRFLRIVLLGLVLVLIAMASALTAMRFAIHGREVKVPKLVGLSVTAAESAANSQGLILLVENKFYSADVPAGHIVSQSPAPDSQVRRGWRLRVAESLGPQRAEIPNVVGQSSRAAEINIGRRGLELSAVAVARIPGAAPGQVIGQSPPAHASGVTSPKISLLTAAPDEDQFFVMPNFVGKHLADVVPVLEKAGMQLGKISDTTPEPPGPIGGPKRSISDVTIIVKQSPAAGQKIVAGSTVNFEIGH